MRICALVLLAACGDVRTVAVDAVVEDAAADAGVVNLVRNGDLAEGVLHWTAVQTELSIVNGGLQLKQTAQGGPGLAWQMVLLTAGHTYRLSARFVARTMAPWRNPCEKMNQLGSRFSTAIFPVYSSYTEAR